MAQRSHDTWSWGFCLVGMMSLTGFWFPGCGRTKPPEELSVEQNLRAIGMAYGRFSVQNRGESPKDEAAFLKYLNESPDVLKTMNVASPDELFKSARDNQAIMVRYGIPPGIPGEAKNVIAYETKGKDGKRFVVYAGGKMEQVDDAKFQQLVPGS